MSEEQMSGERFEYLCKLLPEGVTWGDNINPQMLDEILQAALNSQAKSVPVAPSEAVAKVIRHAMNQVTDYDHSDCRDHGFTQKTLLKAERYISSIIDTTPQPPQSIEADRMRELMEDCASDLEEAAKLFKAYPLMPQNHINAVVLLTRAEQLRKTIAAMKPEKGE